MNEMKNKYTEKEQGLFNKLSKTGKLLYGKLRGMSENLEDVFPSVDGLAKEFECTPRAIAKNLSKMKEMGLIRISHKKSQKSGNICNHYEFPLIYGETLPAPPKEEKINKIENNMVNKPRKKFNDLTNEELVILFTKMKEALNSGSTSFKENIINALDRYTKELKETPAPKKNIVEKETKEDVEKYESTIQKLKAENKRLNDVLEGKENRISTSEREAKDLLTRYRKIVSYLGHGGIFGQDLNLYNNMNQLEQDFTKFCGIEQKKNKLGAVSVFGDSLDDLLS